MEFEVLGVLRVRAGDQAVPLTALMPRTLLAILLIRANRVVPADLLVDSLWPGGRDQRAGKKLHLAVHRLRRALGDPARIRFDHGGYTLRLRPGELDAQRFETVLAEGLDAQSPGQAMPLLRSALELWRGDPFGDVADVPLVRAEIDRLTERRLVGLEALYAAELAGGQAGGQAGGIVPELSELADRYPLRERLQGLLMIALYHAGRRAEALGVYHRTRSALVEELALEPGPELQRVEHAILTGGPMLETTPTAPPAQLPPDITDFTGRTTQLASLRGHLGHDNPAPRTDRTGTSPVSAISGQAGVGKTALAVHAAHQLREHYPHGQLYVDLRGTQPQTLDTTEVLARFLRALGVNGTAIPDNNTERGALYRSLLADRRLLVLLDNAAGEAQVRPLLPAAAGCAVLVTSRTRLAALPGAQLIDLDMLDPGQALDLLIRAIGPQRVATELGAAEEIVRLCGYLPLAVRVAAVRLAARPHWRLARLATALTDEHHRLDELRLGDLEVRASLALSYESLHRTGRRVFRRIGLLGACDVPAWVSTALLGDTEPGAENLMDTLVDTRLLEVAGIDAAGQQRFRCHDLLRAYAREVVTAHEPEAERLAALERVLSGWLALAEEAGERLANPVFGVTVEAVSGWRPEAAAIRPATADPASWFQAEWAALIDAVTQAHAVGLDHLACALGARLAPFYTVRGYYDDWRQICEVMLAAADRMRDHRWMGMALRGLGELALVHYDLDAALDAFRQARTAFSAAGDQHGQAVAVLGIGAVHVEAGRFDEALPCLVHALACFRELTDRRSEGWSLRRLGTLHLLQGQFAQAAVCLQQALGALDEAADPLGTAGALERLGSVRTLQRRPQEAHDLLERSLWLRREHGDHFGEARTLQSLGDLHCNAEQWDRALRCLGAALRLWRRLRLPREQAAVLDRMGIVHENAGNPAAAQRLRREARLLSALDTASATAPDRALLPAR
ncbi:MAG: BTAD domain-containing putative transcriptional regulator [Pseudonocardiaceae bacterium]